MTKPNAQTLIVTPNPMPAGTESIVIEGTGFAPYSQVQTGIVGYLPNLIETIGDGSFYTTFYHVGGIQGPVVGDELLAYAFTAPRKKGLDALVTETIMVV